MFVILFFKVPELYNNLPTLVRKVWGLRIVLARRPFEILNPVNLAMIT